ncbi:MAG TPA: ABC transporter ATP-binding protein [Gemmatimonadales bacterium]|nr:ABC transporter ATP-binding protein [Gemmatimonadales bacterium]
MGTLVEAIGLSRRFGTTEAVRELSFSVEAGALFGIVGPDGAGKTTTLRMLAGVLRPSGGDAVVDGVSVVKDPEGIKHHTAYMPQHFGLYTDLTVQENIAFYADLYRVPQADRPARLERLYQFSRLGQFKTRLAGQLSGGMKQKLGLCCALIHQPRLLLLDEPTFGVDPISRRDLWLILHQMVAEGVTAIVSTAYLDEAERCDQVVLLDGGKAIALDTPEALQASLPGQMLEVRCRNPREAARILAAQPMAAGVSAFGDTLHVRVDASERDWPPLAEALASAGESVIAVRQITPSLEDVFIERTRGAH